MEFISTRNAAIKKTPSQAIRDGLADDGGLYVPLKLAAIDVSQFDCHAEFPVFASQLLKHFFNDDELASQLEPFSKNAFTFPAPLKPINENTFMLELFHGPTQSFKDFGARFLAECLNYLSTGHKTTVMVATSGDTGSAVASAFYQKANINVVVLYPKGKISQRQQQQLTCWGDNVLSLAVDGNFDDCQQLVKSAFEDSWWQQQARLSTANSINIGRLLPQITYYAQTSLLFVEQHNTQAGFIVPSGNYGNVTAAFYAKQLGFPIRDIVLATNANRVMEDYLDTSSYQPRPSIATLANAMDVGKPSNFERLQHLFTDFDEFKKNVSAYSVSDKEIQHTIKDIYQQYQVIICPHTATGFHVRTQLSAAPWIIAATADPAKFETIIEPLINKTVPVAPQLQAMLDKPQQVVSVKADGAQIKNTAKNYFGW